MPQTRVIFFREKNGSAPLLEWLDDLPKKAKVKCRLRVERLRELGHELRRPEADYLQKGFYELRVQPSGINYRMLYFFHGNTAAVVSHGIVKESAVPPNEINRAVATKVLFATNPERHSYQEEDTPSEGQT